MALESRRGHQVIITNNGEDCLKLYNNELQSATFSIDPTLHVQPFDAVVLDYKMPKINGMEVAKEILALNPHQRIIFASAYVKETLLDSIQQLDKVIELIQKPFEEDVLVDAIEDKEIYAELQKLNVNVDDIKASNFRHEQLRDLLQVLNLVFG
jgi:CheY-like chemotaxis protein